MGLGDRGLVYGTGRVNNYNEARRLWELGTRALTSGQIDEALEFFEQSIESAPTAEGYTFRGWALSYKRRFEEAIADCRRAIDIDPDFGNPYNDIGVYLMQMGQLEEAIPWLEQAKLAPRYEPRHFPHANLGSIYERLGRWHAAMQEYQEALRIEPAHHPAKMALARLKARMN
jgi:Tfp pilus assembly protein PilF